MSHTQFSALWLQQLRQRLGLTQQEFSRQYSISLRTIQKWEQGVRKPEGPALSLLLVISAMPNQVASVISKANLSDPSG